MAPPLERWYLGAIRNEEDLHRSLRNLERILERKDEIFQGSSVPGAPDDATYIVQNSDPDLPNARELVDGVNTTVDYGAPGEASIDVADAPPSGPAGGDIGGTYPDPTVTGILDEPIEAGTPSNFELIQFLTVPSRRWERLVPGGDLATVSLGNARVQRIQQNPVESGTPTAGDVYRWDGSQFVRWSPKYMTASLSGNQTTDIGDGQRVQFDDVLETSGHISVVTGTFSLPAGTFRLTAQCGASFGGSTGEVALRWAESGGGTLGGGPAVLRHADNTTNPVLSGVNETIVDGPINVVLRILSPTNLTNISASTNVTITALT